MDRMGVVLQFRIPPRFPKAKPYMTEKSVKYWLGRLDKAIESGRAGNLLIVLNNILEKYEHSRLDLEDAAKFLGRCDRIEDLMGRQPLLAQRVKSTYEMFYNRTENFIPPPDMP